MAGQFNFGGVGEYEWADAGVWFGGAVVGKCTGFEYGIETEHEHLFAAGDQAIDIQSGNRTPKGSFTVLMSTLNQINAAIQAAGGRDIGDVVVDLAFTYKPVGLQPPVSDVCANARIKGYKKALKQNDKKDEITLEFLYLE